MSQVNYRMHRNMSMWNMCMPDAEVKALTTFIEGMVDEALTFDRKHVRYDMFYPLALEVWDKKIERVKQALAQLCYYGHVVSYTVREQTIHVLWADKWGETVWQDMQERIKLRFSKMAMPYEPMKRNDKADTLWFRLDSYSIRNKMDAAPEPDDLDSWTSRHYTNQLTEGAAGATAHYMHMKLEGAKFQFELVRPTHTPVQRERAKRTETNTKLERIANKWRSV